MSNVILPLFVGSVIVCRSKLRVPIYLICGWITLLLMLDLCMALSLENLEDIFILFYS